MHAQYIVKFQCLCDWYWFGDPFRKEMAHLLDRMWWFGLINTHANVLKEFPEAWFPEGSGGGASSAGHDTMPIGASRKRPAPGPPHPPTAAPPLRAFLTDEDCRCEFHDRLSDLSLASCRMISVVLTCVCIDTVSDSSLVSCRMITVVLTCLYTASCSRVCSHEHA
jgi:hypothetical protein